MPIINKLNCTIPNLTKEFEEDSIKNTFRNDPDMVSDATRRVDRLKQIMGWQSGVSQSYRQTNQAIEVGRELVYGRLKKVLNKNNITSVNKQNIRKTSFYRFFLNTERLARGHVDEALATLEVENVLHTIEKNLDGIKKQYNLTDNDIAYVKTKGVEVGWQPYLQDYDSVTPNGYTYLVGQQQSYIQTLRNDFGISDADIDQIVDMTRDVSQVYHEVLLIAKSSGVEVGDLTETGMGYLPRQFSEDFQRRRKWAVDTKEGKIKYSSFDSGTEHLTETFQKARSSDIYINEDSVLMDYALKKAAGDDVYKQMSDRTGLVIRGVDDLFDNDKALYDAVIHILPDQFIDEMVASGLVSKLPVASDVLFKKLKSHYKLPYDNVNELMNVDFVRGVQLYKKQLEEVAINSNKLYAFVRDSIDNNWSVAEKEVFENLDKYKDYVSFRDVIPESLRKKFDLEDLYDDLGAGSMYIPREAAQELAAELKLITDPVSLGVLAQGLSFTKRLASTMWLSTSQYVGRQYISAALQLTSAGGNVAEYVGLTMRAALNRTKGKSLFTNLENTKKSFTINGQKVTEQELFNELVKTGYINDFTHAVIEATSRTYTPKTNYFVPDNIVKQLSRTKRQWANTLQQYPGQFGKNIEEIGKNIDNLVNGSVGSVFNYANIEIENLSKFALAKTVFGSNRIVPVLTGSISAKSIKTADDFVEYASRYFYWYDEKIFGGASANKIGKGIEEVASSILPFMNYRTKNLHGTFRQMIHNPSKFGNYLYAYALANEHAEQYELPDDAVPDYVKDQFPIFYKDKGNNGEDAYFYFPLSNIIQQFGALGDLQGFQELLFGDGKPYGRDSSFIDRLLSSGYPLMRVGKALITTDERGFHIDPKYGNAIENSSPYKQLPKEDSLLGVSIHPLAKWIINTLITPIDRLDKWNPGKVFGTPDKKDQDGNVIQEGQQSWAGAERYKKDENIPEGAEQGNLFTELAGVQPKYIDRLNNMGYSMKEQEYAIKDTVKLLGEINDRLEASTNDKQRQKWTNELYEKADLVVQIEIERRKAEVWMEVHDIDTVDGIQYLKDNGISTSSLPDLTDAEKQEIRQKIMKQVFNKPKTKTGKGKKDKKPSVKANPINYEPIIK